MTWNCGLFSVSVNGSNSTFLMQTDRDRDRVGGEEGGGRNREEGGGRNSEAEMVLDHFENQANFRPQALR